MATSGTPTVTRRRFAVAAALTGMLTLTGCSSPGVTWHKGGELVKPVTLAITSPEPDAASVPTSVEIGLKLRGADEVDVALASGDGKPVPGAMREDGSTWVPGTQLAYDTTYRIKVTATNKTGGKAAKTATFTTMTKPAQLVGTGLYLFDNQKVGVGMPVVVEFSRPVEDRAAIEKRLFVTSEPETEGAWHWFGDSQVHYRPKDYWTPGTKLSVRIAVGGLPFGDGWHGQRDRVARDVVVGDDVRLVVDDHTKRLTLFKDGEPIKKMPVSLGKKSTPSSSGNMVIMDKRSEMMFDSSTYGVPADSAGGYRTKVRYAMRLTWGGEFIHAAPWSVADQGRRNVSHGCVNLSTADARFVYNHITVGDPVTVKHTGAPVGKGDGWTGWTMSWETYKAGSALPE